MSTQEQSISNRRQTEGIDRNGARRELLRHDSERQRPARRELERETESLPSRFFPDEDRPSRHTEQLWEFR
jgi:hypothetical protein